MKSVLHGKSLVNTRALHQAGEFDQLIQERGAIPLPYPCIAMQAPPDTSKLDSALKRLIEGEFDWLVLTSRNTVWSLAQRLQALGLSLVHQPAFKIAAIGSSTAQFIQEMLSLQVDLLPDEYLAESLAETLLSTGAKRIFLPESGTARPTLGQMLKVGGAEVEVVTAYQTICGQGGINLTEYLRRKQVDIVTFTSSSTVQCFFERLRHETEDDVEFRSAVCFACIGPKTAKTAADYGLMNVIVPTEYTLIGLLDAIENHFEQNLRMVNHDNS